MMIIDTGLLFSGTLYINTKSEQGDAKDIWTIATHA